MPTKFEFSKFLIKGPWFCLESTKVLFIVETVCSWCKSDFYYMHARGKVDKRRASQSIDACVYTLSAILAFPFYK